LETRVRVRGAAVTAVVGAVALAITAAASGLDTPLGWGLYGLVIGGVSGYVATPWIVRDRPRSALALAVLLYAMAVLLYPILGPIVAVEAPMSGTPRLDRLPSDLLRRYALSPIGFLSAIPFAPATLLTAAAAGIVIRRWLGGPVVRHGVPVEPVEAAPSAESTSPSDTPRSQTRTRLEAIQAAAAPEVTSDRTFGRRVAIAVGVIVLVTIAGYALLASLLSNIGY
jgi:hypothetical protein